MSTATREGFHKGEFLVNGNDWIPADQKIPDHKYVDQVRCSCGSSWAFLEPTRLEYEENHRRAKACLAEHQHEMQSAGT